MLDKIEIDATVRRPPHPSQEIEITPAMVDAGEKAVDKWLEAHGYFDGDSGDLFDPDFVRSVFSAMAGISPTLSRKSRSSS